MSFKIQKLLYIINKSVELQSSYQRNLLVFHSGLPGLLSSRHTTLNSVILFNNLQCSGTHIFYELMNINHIIYSFFNKYPINLLKITHFFVVLDNKQEKLTPIIIPECM